MMPPMQFVVGRRIVRPDLERFLLDGEPGAPRRSVLIDRESAMLVLAFLPIRKRSNHHCLVQRVLRKGHFLALNGQGSFVDQPTSRDRSLLGLLVCLLLVRILRCLYQRAVADHRASNHCSWWRCGRFAIADCKGLAFARSLGRVMQFVRWQTVMLELGPLVQQVCRTLVQD